MYKYLAFGRQIWLGNRFAMAGPRKCLLILSVFFRCSAFYLLSTETTCLGKSGPKFHQLTGAEESEVGTQPECCTDQG